MFNRVDTALSFDLRSYSNEVDGKNRGVTVESYGRKTLQNSSAFVSTPLKTISLNAEPSFDRTDSIARSIYNQLVSDPLLTCIEYRNVEWPPTMFYPSEALKKCLGDSSIDNRTLKKRLLELGYKRDIKYIVTAELIERINNLNLESTPYNLSDYQAKSDYAKSLL